MLVWSRLPALILVGVTLVELSAAQGPSISVRVIAPGLGTITDLSIVKVATLITNTGSAPLTLLKDPTTALTAFPTNIFTLVNWNNGRRPHFIGVVVKFASDLSIVNGLLTSLDPGATVEMVHDLTNAYDFSTSGPGTYTIDISPRFQALNNLNKTFSLTASVTSTVLSLIKTLDHDLKKVLSPSTPLYKTSAIEKRHFMKRATYVGCSPLHQIGIRQAAIAAQEYAAQAYAYASQNVDNETARFLTWFGVYHAQRYDTVLTHLSNLKTDDFTSFTYSCTCLEPNAYAYVSPERYGEIYLCGAFWLAPNTGKNSKAGTLIHEASHFTRNGGTEDHVYGTSACQDLAKSNPEEAVANADSYEYFTENPTGLA